MQLNAGPSAWTRPEVHPKLVELLKAWQQSSEKWRRLVRAWKASKSPLDSIPRPVQIRLPEGCPTLFEIQDRCQVLLSPNPRGSRWHPGVAYTTRGKPWTAWDLACSRFVWLVLEPECHRFGGPCPYCGDFFFKTTAKERRYCSEKCAHKESARTSTKQRRLEEHKHKVREVKKAIREWRRSARKEDWREWVASAVQDVSTNWLTRALKQKLIEAPKTDGRKSIGSAVPRTNRRSNER